MEINGREIVAWSCDRDAETLRDTERDEAIQTFLGGRDLWEGTITVYGYARMQIPDSVWDRAAERVLEYTLEPIDEEYGNPEDDPSDYTGITEASMEAAKAFVAVVRKEYQPFCCEVVHTEEVDVAAWIAEYNPQWLKDKP